MFVCLLLKSKQFAIFLPSYILSFFLFIRLEGNTHQFIQRDLFNSDPLLPLARPPIWPLQNLLDLHTSLPVTHCLLHPPHGAHPPLFLKILHGDHHDDDGAPQLEVRPGPHLIQCLLEAPPQHVPVSELQQAQLHGYHDAQLLLQLVRVPLLHELLAQGELVQPIKLVVLSLGQEPSLVKA